MKTFIPFTRVFFIFFTIISCQKIELRQSKNGTALLQTDASTFASTSLLVSAPFVPIDNDSIERPTTLGVQLTNPYLIPNMQQAYKNLGYNPNLATVTNLYVRFKPTVDQLAALDSIMDAQGLDLFDTPMDYDITYEGDYYQDPSIPDSLPTWQYAVVPPSFSFPAGITYQTLAQIHIPSDDYTAIETEAENIAGGAGNQAQATPTCTDGHHYDPILKKCVLDNSCPSGYYWDEVNQICKAYKTIPPPPASDAATPRGNIFVHDTNLGSDVGVRKVRVVAKRWFKVERTYTDNNGHFSLTKKFKHKVKINAKFENDDAQVKNIRGASLWQMFFPVKYTLGIFSSDKSNIVKVFSQFPDYGAKGNMFWTAATVHNAVQEYRDYATSEHIGLPPQGLKIFVSRAGMAGNGGATPMFGKRAAANLATEYVLFRVSNIASIVYSIISIIKAQMDMVIGYRYETNGHRDITQLLSDRIKETTYHELTHSGHYAALGSSWYTTFVNAEIFEIVSNFSSGYSPYGDGSNSQSAIVALGESWAYHIGHFFADRRYTTNCSAQTDQGFAYSNNFPINGLSSHLNLLENFSPYRTGDPFHWIPTGLFYDMFDTRNEQKSTGGPVDDNVSGYTNQQFFNAFSSSITTLGSYRSNLLQQNGNNQSTQVIYLFSQYGY